MNLARYFAKESIVSYSLQLFIWFVTLSHNCNTSVTPTRPTKMQTTPKYILLSMAKSWTVCGKFEVVWQCDCGIMLRPLTDFIIMTGYYCPALGNPIHGSKVAIPQYRVNTYIRFRCNHGYEMVGSEERMCTFSGEWTGEMPRCMSKKNNRDEVLK